MESESVGSIPARSLKQISRIDKSNSCKHGGQKYKMYEITIKLTSPTLELELDGQWLKWSDLQNVHELHFGCLSITTEARKTLQTLAHENTHAHFLVEATIKNESETVLITGSSKDVKLLEISNLPMVHCTGKSRFQVVKNEASTITLNKTGDNEYPELFFQSYWKNPVGQDRKIGVPLDAVHITNFGDAKFELCCRIAAVQQDIMDALSVMKRELSSEKGYATELFITDDRFHRIIYSSQDLIIEYDVVNIQHMVKLVGTFHTSESWDDDLNEIDYEPYTTV